MFVWGGVGRAHIGETSDDQFAWNVGGQVDYETRSVYASLRTDLHEASAYSHRIDTLQLGVAPYEHDYQTLAVWFVIQARQYTGGLLRRHRSTQRCCGCSSATPGSKPGVTQDGKLQAMLMFNF